jgi:hypothetical protein
MQAETLAEIQAERDQLLLDLAELAEVSVLMFVTVGLKDIKLCRQ